MSSPRFVTTRWSQVLAAQGGDEARARAALEELCRSYWYPLYAYGRRRGLEARAAEDAVQGFFAELLEKDRLALVDRERGRFRGFLVTAFQRYLGHEREKAAAQKRGGGARVLSLDDGDPEARYAREPAHEATPERAFERAWALAVLERALRGLRAAYEERGQATLFEEAKAYLIGEAEAPMAEAAARLGLREGAFRVAVHRLRRRYRAAVRAEVAQTLPAGALEAGEDEVELRELAAALARE
ncbi:MAG: RNA polymerase sigma factor [Planctomycetota bacterium]